MKNIKEICIEEPSLRLDDSDFMNWFDPSIDVEDAVKKGKNDFNQKIFTENVNSLISTETCLEIGFGGGRLMNEACNHFDNVFGVDIHNEFGRTSSFLEGQGKSNFALIHSDDIETIQEKTIDFVYSFIVFQHFENWEVAKRYLEMIERVLKDDGVAVIFFGATRTGEDIEVQSTLGQSRKNFWWSSLRLSEDFIRKSLENFEIIEVGKYKRSNQIFSRFRKR